MSSTQRPDLPSSVIDDAVFECAEKICGVWEAAGLNAESEAEILTQEIHTAVSDAFERLLFRRGVAIDRLKRGSGR